MNLEFNTTSLRIAAEAEGYQLTEQDKQDLDTEYAQLVAIWKHLSSEKIAELISNGTITTWIQSNNNQNVIGPFYEGKSEMRSVYVHVLTRKPIKFPDNLLAEAHPWIVVDASPAQVKHLLGYGVGQSEAAQLALVTVNGGTMPQFLDPSE